MGCKKHLRLASFLSVQIFNDRPGYAQSVIRGSPSADLVKHYDVTLYGKFQRAHKLWTEGVQRELAPGQVVTVTEENVQALSTQIEDLPGNLPQDIRIVTGDYYLEEELLQKATWAPVTAEPVPQEAPEPMAEPAPQEMAEPMAEPAPQETPEPLAGAEPPQSPASAPGFPRQD